MSAASQGQRQTPMYVTQAAPHLVLFSSGQNLQNRPEIVGRHAFSSHMPHSAVTLSLKVLMALCQTPQSCQ